MNPKTVAISIKRFTKDHLTLTGYVILFCCIMVSIVTIESCRHSIFGTRLLLGWDSPAYVWSARDIISKGPLSMIEIWDFPYLYTQLLAFLGYLSGNIVIVERILPLFFGFILVYANSRIVFEITKQINTAGLAAFLTVFSLNLLRLLSDLHRNLAAFALGMTLFLLVPNLETKKPLLNDKYALLVLELLVIASTHFETYVVLSISLVLYGCLSARAAKLKTLVMLVSACVIPVAILISLFPAYFLGYVRGAVFLEHALTLNDIALWVGGSWTLFGFLVIGAAYSLYKTIQRDNKVVELVFSYFLVISILAVLTGFNFVLTSTFALRVLLILPIPILLALAVHFLTSFLRSVFEKLKAFTANKNHSLKIRTHALIYVRRSLTLLIVLALVVSSVIATFQHAETFLTPYIPRSGYDKILAATEFLKNKGLSRPVVVYYGAPAFWFIGLYRNYIGAELGEHFTYYGSVENLLHLVRSEPRFKDDLSLAEMEKFLSGYYYTELLGNWSGSIPLTFDHQSYITSIENLMSHPLVIITPELYNDEIPYYIRSFYIGEGIYVIPPNSLHNTDEVVYGPSLRAYRNGESASVSSEYLYIDPDDPSLVILRVNGSSGYESINFTGIPANWTLMKIEQGGDLSFPDKDPKRLNNMLAITGNDPADSTQDWSTLQNGTVSIDTSSKKEGIASLKVVGITDAWGNLGVRYKPDGMWDLNKQPLLEVWAKANKKTTFSITLVDTEGESKTFWAIQVHDSSIAAKWKRFVVNLENYTSQTSGFNIANVDFIDFYVHSNPREEMTLWVDDLIIDDFPSLTETVYKARILVEDTLILYFATKDIK